MNNMNADGGLVMKKEVLFGVVHVKMCHSEFLSSEDPLLHCDN